MVSDPKEIMALMDLGNKIKAIGETKMNERSSRSHTIFRIHIESQEDKDGSVRVSQINLVDLAGSERAAATGAKGQRFKEGCNINLSLLQLGNVVQKLSEKKGGHIDYRSSKLTRLLQSSLAGNANISMICNITPVAAEQSQSTLQFALRASTIKLSPHLTEVMDDATTIKRHAKRIKELEQKLQNAEYLEGKNLELQEEMNKLRASFIMSSFSSHHQVLDEQDRSNRRQTWAGGTFLKRKPLVPLTTLYEESFGVGQHGFASDRPSSFDRTYDVINLSNEEQPSAMNFASFASRSSTASDTSSRPSMHPLESTPIRPNKQLSRLPDFDAVSETPPAILRMRILQLESQLSQVANTSPEVLEQRLGESPRTSILEIKKPHGAILQQKEQCHVLKLEESCKEKSVADVSIQENMCDPEILAAQEVNAVLDQKLKLLSQEKENIQKQLDDLSVSHEELKNENQHYRESMDIEELEMASKSKKVFEFQHDSLRVAGDMDLIKQENVKLKSQLDTLLEEQLRGNKPNEVVTCKEKLIREILGLDTSYTKQSLMDKTLQEIIDIFICIVIDKQQECNSKMQSELVDLKKKNSELKTDLQDRKEEINHFARSKETIQQELVSTREQLSVCNAESSEISLEKSQLQVQVKELLSSLNKSERDHSKIVSNLQSTLQLKMEDLLKKQSTETSQNYAKLVETIESKFNERLPQLESNVKSETGEVCVTSSDSSQLLDEIQELKSKIEFLESKNTENVAMQQTIESLKSDLENSKHLNAEKQKEYENKIVELQTLVSQSEISISDLKQNAELQVSSLEQLCSEKEDIETRRSVLETQLGSLRQEFEIKSQQYENLMSEYESYQSTHAELVKESEAVSKYKLEISELKSQLGTSSNQYQELEAECSLLKQEKINCEENFKLQMSQLEVTITDTRLQLDTLKSEYSDCQQLLDQLKQERGDETTKYANDIALTSTRITELTEQVKRLESEYSRVTSENCANQTEITKLLKTIDDANASFQTSQKVKISELEKIKQLVLENDELHQLIKNLKSQLKSAVFENQNSEEQNQLISSLQDNITKANTKLNVLQGEKEALMKQLEEAKTDIGEKDTKLIEAEDEFQAMLKDYKIHYAKRNEFEREACHLEIKNKKLETKVAELETKIAQLPIKSDENHDLAECQQELQEKTCRITEQDLKLTEYKTTGAQLQSQVDELMKEKQKLRRELADKRGELAIAERKLIVEDFPFRKESEQLQSQVDYLEKRIPGMSSEIRHLRSIQHECGKCKNKLGQNASQENQTSVEKKSVGVQAPPDNEWLYDRRALPSSAITEAARMYGMKQQIQDLEAKIKDLEAKISDLKTDRTMLKYEIHKQNQTIYNLRAVIF